jgi:hypothetical protein
MPRRPGHQFDASFWKRNLAQPVDDSRKLCRKSSQVQILQASKLPSPCGVKGCKSQRGHFQIMDTSELTREEKDVIDRINKMSHEEMCRLWRFSPPGHMYFDSNKPYAKVFSDRLFKHFGGFTPEISKAIGW